MHPGPDSERLEPVSNSRNKGVRPVAVAVTASVQASSLEGALQLLDTPSPGTEIPDALYPTEWVVVRASLGQSPTYDGSGEDSVTKRM